MNRGDVRLLRTLATELKSNRPLKIAKALKQLQAWYDEHNQQKFIKPKTNKLFSLANKTKTSLANIDQPNLNKYSVELANEINVISDFINSFLTKSDGEVLRLVKMAVYREVLPESKVTVIPKNGTLDEKIRFLRILMSALRVELDADCCSMHKSGNDIELQVDIHGSLKNVISAVSFVTDGVSDAFKLSSGIDIKCGIKKGASEKGLLDHGESERQFRKFAMRVWGCV